MKTNVRESSIEAYYDKIIGSDKTKKIEQYVKDRPAGVTRRMIAVDLGMETATVSGIVKPLIDEKVFIESESTMPCRVTGRYAHWVFHKDFKNIQLTLV